jgi:membrane-bound metal-dependent hydrolase YbcI (DUF457 family)
MAGPIAHTLAAYSVLITAKPEILEDRHKSLMAWATAFAFGNMADADFAVGAFTKVYYLQHHYFSHSIPFAAAVTILCILVLKALRDEHSVRNGLILGLMYGTHLLIDLLTEDGSRPYGIPLLWPITTHHSFSPYVIFYSIHRGNWHQVFSWHNIVGLVIEIAVLLPVAGLARFRAQKNSLPA